MGAAMRDARACVLGRPFALPATLGSMTSHTLSLIPNDDITLPIPRGSDLHKFALENSTEFTMAPTQYIAGVTPVGVAMTATFRSPSTELLVQLAALGHYYHPPPAPASPEAEPPETGSAADAAGDEDAAADSDAALSLRERYTPSASTPRRRFSRAAIPPPPSSGSSWTAARASARWAASSAARARLAPAFAALAVSRFCSWASMSACSAVDKAGAPAYLMAQRRASNV